MNIGGWGADNDFIWVSSSLLFRIPFFFAFIFHVADFQRVGTSNNFVLKKKKKFFSLSSSGRRGAGDQKIGRSAKWIVWSKGILGRDKAPRSSLNSHSLRTGVGLWILLGTIFPNANNHLQLRHQFNLKYRGRNGTEHGNLQNVENLIFIARCKITYVPKFAT